MIRNIQERTYPGVDPQRIGALIDDVGGPDDLVWSRTGRFPAMRLDAPVAEGGRGGHGIVRYETVAHTPGRSATWRFDPELGLHGTHGVELVDTPAGPMLRHTIEATASGSMRLGWPLAVRWLHEACLVELFDQVQATLDGTEPVERRHGWWVRFLLRVGPTPAQEEARVAEAA